MSTLKVEVQTVDEVLPHPNADRMAVLKIGGHTTCTGLKNVGTADTPDYQCPYAAGDPVLYVPPDAIIPDEVAEAWGVKPYLGHDNRVKTVKLRGFVSRGFVVPVPVVDGKQAAVGTDLADAYGITKYDPPAPESEHHEPELTGFHRYTDIERIQNYPDVFVPGEPVYVTEKIHGTNSRVGLVRVDGDMVTVCGTHRCQVKLGAGSKYEYPLTLPAMGTLLRGLTRLYPQAESIIVFGEIYGQSVQGVMGYGLSGQDLGYRVFDIAVDNEYLPLDTTVTVCTITGLEIANVLFVGPFDMEMVESLSDGPSTISGANHIREGVVIRPYEERYDDRLGRVILKRIGDSYECKQYEWGDSH